MESCRLFHALVEHLEIVLGQVWYQVSAPVNDDRVDFDKIDVRSVKVTPGCRVAPQGLLMAA